MSLVKRATGLDEVLNASKSNPDTLHVLNFWASWAEPCVHMNQVFEALAATHVEATFWDVDAESVGDLAIHFCIEAVPTFVLVKGGAEISRINGAKPDDLANAISKALTNTTITTNVVEDMNTRLTNLINRHKFMIFIKGTPKRPQCGFTGQLLRLLSQYDIEYDYFDIFSDEAVRQDLKSYSKWPTYPQIYVKGELVGGLDIFNEIIENGQLEDLLN